MKLSELMSSLSLALDITEGQPPGHCVRSCWIGMHVGRALGLSDHELWELYYVLLLKDLGCSSNAARICSLYMTDDLSFKREFKTVGDNLAAVVGFVVSHTGLKAGLAERFKATMNIFKNGTEISTELIQTRCQRGGEIAKLLRFSDAVSAGIYSLDEHFNGKGKPHGISGDQIPIYSQVALLAQVADVMNRAKNPAGACQEIAHRSGSWFSLRLAQAFESAQKTPHFWEVLADEQMVQRLVLSLPPGALEVQLDEDYLDDIATAFGQIVDSKSPYTSGHSARVAVFTDLIASEMGLPAERRRWLKRGALLHDIGKLGVSNSILDKPGKLDDAEWVEMRRHAELTEKILFRMQSFQELARVAGAHHERLDGQGYPRGLTAEFIALETRIITTADIFDALTADRPYRESMPAEKAFHIMDHMSGTALDPLCLKALKASFGKEHLQ
jgi:putative nucleotidyltransferase with HDIG domain